MTRLDKERIASLANHPGFIALLGMLDEADSILLEKLEIAPKEKEEEILSLWRGSRRFHRMIKSAPQDFFDTISGPNTLF